MRGAPLALLVAAAACGTGAGSAPASSASAAGSASVALPASSAVLASLRAAELAREPGGVPKERLGDRDPAVRRAAARALSRIGGPSARELLVALSDDDPEVVALSAYGLGFACKGAEEPTLSALAARLATAPDDAAWTPARSAVVRAAGRCGTARAEELLRRWLSLPAPLAEDAAIALSELARATKTLREETLVELLRVAEGALGGSPVPLALGAFARVDNVPPAVSKRLLEVAGARLTKPHPHRIAAARALVRAGVAARAPLQKLLDDASATPGERAEAAAALGRLDDAAGLVDWALAHVPADAGAFSSPSFAVPLAALRAVAELPRGAKKAELARLAAIEPPKGATPPVVRRVSALRCEAARLASGGDPTDAAFAACDLDPGAPGGSLGLRLRVAALDGAPIEGARLELFRKAALGPDLRAREAALALLVKHPEVSEGASLLAQALAAKEAGVVAAAAEVLATRPERASEAPKKRPRKKKKGSNPELADPPAEAAAPAVPSKALVKVLLEALERSTDPEATAALLDAAAALGLAEARAKMEAACASPWPTSRERARAGLRALGKKDAECPAPEKSEPPPEASRLASAPLVVELDTDVGKLRLELDPTHAPAAVTRVAELARAGFYDGMVIHRVVPGFVAQLGSPTYDGVGGPPLPPLRCETSPAPPFEPLAVGIALGGRDTGSSQFFVMLGPGRHLDGIHAWIGKASGPWEALVEGDRVTKAKVL